MAQYGGASPSPPARPRSEGRNISLPSRPLHKMLGSLAWLTPSVGGAAKTSKKRKLSPRDRALSTRRNWKRKKRKKRKNEYEKRKPMESARRGNFLSYLKRKKKKRIRKEKTDGERQ